MRAGHYSQFFLLALAPFLIAWLVAGVPDSGLIDMAADVAWAAWLVTMLADTFYHQNRLCERCIRVTPLDPQAAVDRWRPALRAVHSPRLGIASVAVFAAFALGSALVPSHSLEKRLIALPVLAVIAGWFTAQYKHRRLQPWCPWCHWDDGGDEELVPDNPAPVLEKT
jgi:hypothetical protein